MTIYDLQRKISGSIKLLLDVLGEIPAPCDSYGWAQAFATLGSILETDEIPLVFRGVALQCRCELPAWQIREFASTIIAARLAA